MNIIKLIICLSQPCLSKLFCLDNYYCESKGFTSWTYAALKNKTSIYLLINKLSINMLTTHGGTLNQSFLASHPSSRWVKVGCCYFWTAQLLVILLNCCFAVLCFFLRFLHLFKSVFPFLNPWAANYSLKSLLTVWNFTFFTLNGCRLCTFLWLLPISERFSRKPKPRLYSCALSKPSLVLQPTEPLWEGLHTGYTYTGLFNWVRDHPKALEDSHT